MADQIEFTAEKFKAFKKAYDKAITDKKDQFEFEGHEVLVSYAKYVIQYLTPKFDKKK